MLSATGSVHTEKGSSCCSHSRRWSRAVALVFRSSPAAPLFAPGAALFVTARFYTGDPYYRPTFRTYADGGIFSPAWVFTLLGLAFVAGLTTYFWRRTGSVESAVVLALLFLTALYMGAGH